MSRLVRDSNLGTREARRKLIARKVPYWRHIVTGIHLGYYKGNKNSKWQVKARTPEGKYIWQVIGSADDFVDANGKTVLNYSQAQDIAKKIGEKIRLGTDYEETRLYTVKNAVEDYLADFKANGKKSLYATETQIKAHILPFFAEKGVSTLSFKQLNVWKNKLATTDKRARSSKKLNEAQKYISNDNDVDYLRRRRATANRIITILKAILNHAFNTNRVNSNEAWQKLKPFKNVTEPKIRFLFDDEITRLLNASAPDFALLLRGALLTGARYGELTLLKATDYNGSNNSIYVHQSKNGKSRHIPLNQEGINFFEQLIRDKNPQSLIFTRADGTPWKKNYQVRPLRVACKAANIKPAINFHILRHTYGSALARRGVPLQVIAAALGHSDTRITHKHYAHLMPSDIANMIKDYLPSFGNDENKEK